MAKKPFKPILALDFDGVIHAYTSGWKGPRCIPDPPVDGALEYIVQALEHFDVQIYSSRSNYWGGRWAMRRWLRDHYRREGMAAPGPPVWLQRVTADHATMEPPPHDVIEAVGWILRQVKFPKHKPPALVTLDDRALTFRGRWPAPDDLLAFKPWYK